MGGKRHGRFAFGSWLGALAALLTFAGIALAALGLQNPSFENDLDGWTVKTERGNASNRTVVYGEGGKKGAPVPCSDRPYSICVVGTDTFEYVNTGNYTDVRTATVEPVDGEKMLRLGGPYKNGNLSQLQDRFVAEQSFMVDPENPVLQMNYNIFTYDYQGFDEFEFKLTVTDEDGAIVAREVQGSFGSSTELKTSGWQPNEVDLSAFAGEQLHLKLSSGGTSDSSFPFWAYVDAGLVEAPPVSGSGSSATAPELPGGGTVNLNKYNDPGTGQAFFTLPASQASQFPSGCVPLTFDVPIDPGAGTVSNVVLRLDDEPFPMTDIGGSVWRGTIDCAENGSLVIEYDLTEEGVTQHFVVPLGGLVLIDPQGVVHDLSDYDDAIAGGATPEEARAAAAITGATVRLQRESGGTFVNVLSGDPGISPNVNPQITGADGLFQWDVSAGTYRVLVTKLGYVTVVSRETVIPPPELALHIPMEEFETTIDSGPTGSTSDSTPTFGFSSNDPAGTEFECRVDGASFAPCGGSTSHTTAPLSGGAHTFEVRGTDSTGFTDPSPAKRSFTVVSSTGGGGGGAGGGECTAAEQAVDAAEEALAAAQTKAKKAKEKAKKAKKAAKKSDSKKADKKAKKAKEKSKKAKNAVKSANSDLTQAEQARVEACA